MQKLLLSYRRDSGLPYKLLITIEMKQPRKYRSFLSEGETVSGSKTIFVSEVRNIGDEQVPKGSVRFTMERPAGTGSLSVSTEDLEISALSPDEFAIIEASHIPRVPGFWVLYIKIKPKDEKEIEYYSSKDGKPMKEWTRVYYVVDRHLLDVKSLLRKLMKKV